MEDLKKCRSLVVSIALSVSQCIYGGESMDGRQVLEEFENLYDAILPAQEKSQETFFWLSNVPHPLFNAVIHLSCLNVSEKVDALLEQASSFRQLSFWIHPENRAEGLVDVLAMRQFTSIITCPLMAWNVNPVAPKSTSASDIRPADMEVFYPLLFKVYQCDDPFKQEFQKLMGNVDCENYILYSNQCPVSTVTLFVQGKVGGIFNDATLPERREASKEMMRFVMHRAHELGLKRLIVLSSPEGESLYKDLGFINLFPIEVYARQ